MPRVLMRQTPCKGMGAADRPFHTFRPIPLCSPLRPPRPPLYVPTQSPTQSPSQSPSPRRTPHTLHTHHHTHPTHHCTSLRPTHPPTHPLPTLVPTHCACSPESQTAAPCRVSKVAVVATHTHTLTPTDLDHIRSLFLICYCNMKTIFSNLSE